MKYPIEPLPEDSFSIGGGGSTTGAATTVRVRDLLEDKPFESVAVNDSVISPALEGATKLAAKVVAFVSVMLVPAVCCHK